MKIFVVTAFPELLQGALNESILKRAQEAGVVQIERVDLRDFATDRHRQVDDYPYGGGPGMVLKPEPFFRAVKTIKTALNSADVPVILMTPQGSRYDQKRAKELRAEQNIIFLCGHYKGIDERVRQHLVTEEISIGDYVLTGGELAALVIIDSVVRLLPGAIGDLDSALSDSFENNRLDCPHYTRPEVYEGLRVPEVLVSGNHAKIEEWRTQQALERTRSRRLDILEKNQRKTKLHDRNGLEV